VVYPGLATLVNATAEEVLNAKRAHCGRRATTLYSNSWLHMFRQYATRGFVLLERTLQFVSCFRYHGNARAKFIPQHSSKTLAKHETLASIITFQEFDVC